MAEYDEVQALIDEICRQFSPMQISPPPYDTSVTFRMGVVVPQARETARQKNTRLREARKKKLEEQRRKKRKLVTKGPSEPFRPWRIVPNHACTAAAAFCVDVLSGSSYLSKKQSLDKLSIKPTSGCCKLPPLPSAKDTRKRLAALKKEAAALIEKNQKVRSTLRRFLHLWRIQHLKLHNTEDPITMSLPEKPVYVYSLKQRRKYQFDAVSLARTFHLRLLHHDGPFPNALQPMNPFTNELLTLSQCISIFDQLRFNAVTHWTLEAFRRSRFSLPLYMKAHDKALKQHALKAILWDYKDYDGIDTVFDFIESQHDYHDQTFHKPLYVWFLQNMPDEVTMLQWRRLCQKWHENDILEGEGVCKEVIYERIYKATEALCEKPTQLLVKRRLFLAQTK